MRRDHSPHVLALVVVFGLLAAPEAWAHTRPAVVGLVADDGDLVLRAQIAHGLVARDGAGRMRFSCPSLWGGPDVPLAAALGDTTLAIGSFGPVTIRDDGTASARAAPGLTALTSRRLVPGPNGPIALVSDGVGAAVFEVRADRVRPLRAFDVPVDAIVVAGDHVLAARPTAEGVHLDVLSFEGELVEAIDLEATLEPGARVQLARANGSTFAVLAGAKTSTLARVRGGTLEYIFAAPSPIRGPLWAGDTFVVLVGDVLHRVDEDDLGPVDPARAFSCLVPGSFGAFVCEGPRLLALAESGEVERVAFDLVEVEGPSVESLRALPEQLGLACRLEWRDFAVEAGLDPTLPDEVTVAPDEGSGCSCGSTRSPGSAAWILGLVLGLCRTRRSARGLEHTHQRVEAREQE